MFSKIKKLMIKRILTISSPKKRAVLVRKYLKVDIGEGCHIYPGVDFGSEPYLIKLGNNVRITNGVRFITHDGGLWVLRNNGMLEDADLFGRIIIGNNVHIGLNAVIMPGVSIGDNVIIGVGSIVTKDVPSNVVVAGVPARVIKSIDDYYHKNKEYVVFTKHMPMKEKRQFLINKYISK